MPNFQAGPERGADVARRRSTEPRFAADGGAHAHALVRLQSVLGNARVARLLSQRREVADGEALQSKHDPTATIRQPGDARESRTGLSESAGTPVERTPADIARQPAGDPAGDAGQTAPTAAQIGVWAAAQDDWGVLEESRALVEDGQVNAVVRLPGNAPMDVTVTAEARNAIRREVRHRLMRMVYEWRLPLVQELAETHAPSSRLDVQAKLRQTVSGILGALRRAKGDPGERFEYPANAADGQTVIDAVLAALQLDGEGAAESALAAQDGDKAHSDAMKAVGWTDSSTEWCGAFAYSQMATAGLQVPSGAIGANPLTATGPPQAGNLDGWFQYVPPLEIKAGESWETVEAYHVTRGSKRHYQVLPASGAVYAAQTAQFEGKSSRGGQAQDLSQVDIQPGDIVVKDTTKGTFADHITTCRSYDPSTGTLLTVGGNEGDAHPVHGGAPIDLNKNPEPSTVAEGTQKGDKERVYAVGRFSIVDFETHEYRRPGKGK